MSHPRDDLRPGEETADFGSPDAARLHFIGHLQTPFASRADCPRQGDPDNGPPCRVILAPRFVPALDGIERFERIELLYWLHEARRDLTRQSPKGKGALRGTFSLRSPLRPNPIGTSLVRLIAREGDELVVRGLDCLDGTPLLDIKPARCDFAVQAPPK